MKYIVLCAGILGAVVVGSLGAHQPGEKLVQFSEHVLWTDAVLLSDISVDGKPIACGLSTNLFAKPQPPAPFAAGDDWLEHTALSLLNRTQKTIVYGGISLSFLDIGDCSPAHPCASASLIIGQMPAIDAYSGRTGLRLRSLDSERPAIAWQPRQTITIHVSDYMPLIEQRLKEFLPVKALTRVNVHRGGFYFSDGTKWDGGGYSVPDPEHRGKFKDLPPDFFPGIRETYRPMRN